MEARPGPSTAFDDDDDDNLSSASHFSNILTIVSRFADRTSMQAIPYIRASQSCGGKLLWSFLLLLCMFLLAGHLFYLFDVYYSYPKHSTIELGFSALGFPAVTFCNVNPLKRSRIQNSTQPELYQLVNMTEPGYIVQQLQQANGERTKRSVSLTPEENDIESAITTSNTANKKRKKREAEASDESGNAKNNGNGNGNGGVGNGNGNGNSRANPGNGNPNPGNGNPKPGNGNPNPGNGKGRTNPGSGNSNPANGNSNPGNESSNPTTGNPNPGGTNVGAGLANLLQNLLGKSNQQGQSSGNENGEEGTSVDIPRPPGQSQTQRDNGSATPIPTEDAQQPWNAFPKLDENNRPNTTTTTTTPTTEPPTTTTTTTTTPQPTTTSTTTTPPTTSTTDPNWQDSEAVQSERRMKEEKKPEITFINDLDLGVNLTNVVHRRKLEEDERKQKKRKRDRGPTSEEESEKEEEEEVPFKQPSASAAIREEFSFLYSSIPQTQRQVMGHQVEDMLVDCSFSGRRCHPQNFSLLSSTTFGNCFTIDHAAMITTRGGYKGGLSLVVFLESEEYLRGMTAGTGVQIIIHPDGTLPFPEEDGIAIMAGTETNIALRRVNINRLGPPHGECQTGEEFQELYQHTYSRRACQLFCEHTNIMDTCQCYDQESGVYVRSTLKRNSLLPCQSETEMRCMFGIQYDFESGALNCDCENPCSEQSYVKTVSMRHWPADEYTEVLVAALCAQRGEPACQRYKIADPRVIAQSFVKINIFYEDLNYENITEVEDYELVQFASDVGGTIGLWLGLSMLSGFELLQFFFEICVYFLTFGPCKRAPKKPQGHAGRGQGRDQGHQGRGQGRGSGDGGGAGGKAYRMTDLAANETDFAQY